MSPSEISPAPSWPAPTYDPSELPIRNPDHHPLRLIEKARKEGRPLYVSAPMVRYSKLPFRTLVRHYSVDLCYSPMLLAKEFVRSARSRSADFTTSSSDSPLVIQFAANNATDFARAAEMAMPYCDGVNLNCGCPQPWAIHDGVGCAMMKKPRDVADMVRAVKDRCGAEFCVSVKIRIHKDLEETERFVRMVEEAGVDYITVHGRMRQTRSSEPVNLDAIKRIVACARVPVLANGDVFTLEDAHRISGFTGAVGVMAGRGLLLNPALFAGFAKTPWGAVERWLELCARENVKFEIVLWQLGEMLDGLVRKKERSRMGEECRSWVQLLEWLDERFVVRRSGEDGFGMGVEVERREAEVEA